MISLCNYSLLLEVPVSICLGRARNWNRNLLRKSSIIFSVEFADKAEDLDLYGGALLLVLCTCLGHCISCGFLNKESDVTFNYMNVTNLLLFV